MGLETTITHGVLRAHNSLYIRSGGRVGHKWLGVPCLLLHSTGRKSGVERINALTYALDGEDYVLVASKGGAPSSPAWFFNVQANPKVKASVGTKRVEATARIVNQGDADYDRLWKLVNEKNKGRYDAYQKQTERPIPIVVLTPDA